MKTVKLLLAAAALAAGTQLAQAAVSISIGEPGFYGRIDIGGYGTPALLYPEPVLIAPGPRLPPIYLRVPPGHSKNWARYCGRYNACGRPVYFVTDGWYRDDYAPRYREHHGHGNDRGYAPPPQRGYDDHRGYDNRGYDNRGGWDNGHGNGKGHGHGHGRD